MDLFQGIAGAQALPGVSKELLVSLAILSRPANRAVNPCLRALKRECSGFRGPQDRCALARLASSRAALSGFELEDESEFILV
jgi:hypothetical protein